MHKTERVLHFIGAAGDEGRSFTEIQRFVVEMNGLSWSEKPQRYNSQTKRMETDEDSEDRRYRGYWCDWLLGGFYSNSGAGILNSFCEKRNGRWVLTQPIERPFRRPFGTKLKRTKQPVAKGAPLFARGHYWLGHGSCLCRIGRDHKCVPQVNPTGRWNGE